MGRRREGEGVATLMALFGTGPMRNMGQGMERSFQSPVIDKDGLRRIPTTVIHRPSHPPSPSHIYPQTKRSTASTSSIHSSNSSSTRGSQLGNGAQVCLTVSTPLQNGSSSHSVRYTLPLNSRKSSLGSCERERKIMDFDPNGAKWQCCCCNLPTGLKFLAVGEVIISSIITITVSTLFATNNVEITWFLGCLIIVSIIMAIGSVLLFAGLQKHSPQLLYPTVGARAILIIFFTVFCGTAIASPSNNVQEVELASVSMDPNGQWIHHPKNNIEAASESLALRLVGLVFGMLFFAVLVLYSIYLVLRCLGYERSFARLRERRESFIQAGMIDPDLSDCRRGSNC